MKYTDLDISETSLGRLDQMEAMSQYTCQEVLQVSLASLEILRIKAKNFHWNTCGPNFYGDHHTYDGIADTALESIDKIGERIRYLGYCVTATAACYKECSVVTEDMFEDAESMKSDMVNALECVSCYMTEGIDILDQVTANMFQDMIASINKQCYFIRSSL